MSHKEIWFDVYRDTFCKLSLSAASHLIAADVCNDGKHRLVALHQSQKTTQSSKVLRIFSGTEMEREIGIESTAGRLADVGQGLLAVAGGSYVYFFREMRPYFKFELKSKGHQGAMSKQEAEIWACLAQGDMDCASAVMLLREMQAAQQLTAPISHRLLKCTSLSEQQQFLEEHMTSARFSAEMDCITCLAVLRRESTSPGRVTLGTELGFVVWMDESGTQESRRVQVGAPVQFLCGYDQHCVIVCSRTGQLQIVSNTTARMICQLTSPCCGVVTVSEKLLVGYVSKSIDCMDLHGKKEFRLEMHCAIRSLTPMTIPSASLHCLLVLLQTGEIVIYHNRTKLCCLSMGTPVAAVTVGRYGTEDCVLASVFKDGTLDIKVLKRDFDATALRDSDQSVSDPLSEASLQSEALENEESHAMHVALQQNLQQLKFETIKAYAKVVADGEGSFAESKELQLQFNAEVHGLGPKFHIRLEIANVGEADAVHHVSLCLSADATMYRLKRKFIRLPCLLQGQVHAFTVSVECTEEGERVPGDIKVTAIQRGFTYPILMASIKMPLCHLQEI